MFERAHFIGVNYHNLYGKLEVHLQRWKGLSISLDLVCHIHDLI